MYHIFAIVACTGKSGSDVKLHKIIFLSQHDLISVLHYISVDHLVEKYGQGETCTRKCKTCDFEQEIRSGGVHMSEGGSVMVFSNEDEFSCPNCNSNTSNQATRNCGE